jgi:hypothetical protein
MRTAFLLLTLLLASASSQQQVTIPDAVRAAADKITADTLKKDLDFLSSDELRGRNTPSPGYDTAAKHIAERLAKSGLRPLGDDGTFFQRYTMREQHVDTAKAYLEAGGQRLTFGEDFVLRSFAKPLSGTYPMVYVGHGWTVPSKGIDPYAGVDVKGKIVVAHGPRALPKGVEIQQIGRINVGGNPPFVEAERRGAVGVIFIPLTSALSNWEQARGQNTVVRELDPPVPSAYAAVPVTSVLLSLKGTETLLSGEPGGGPKIIALGDSGEYHASFQLEKRLTVNIPAARTTEVRPYNVVALLEGSDPALKSEYITIESHLDGAVGNRTVDGDAIYNSADDNASGSAANLSIAEQMAAGPRPKRSVIFIWDSGEERGLWGTRHFVGNPPVPLDRIVTHFNIDMIGASRTPGTPDEQEKRLTGPNEVFVLGPRALSAKAEALLAMVNASYLKMILNHDHDRPESEYFYPRTDAGPFLERGILIVGFTTGNHQRYHLPADEARHLHPAKMETIARTIFMSAWMFANANERPGIDKGIPATVPRYK